MIKLTLPYPPSVNHIYATTRDGRRVMTTEGKNYKAGVMLQAKTQRVKQMEGALKLSIDIFRPRKSGDLDNRIKILQDSLQGVAYKNDSQIVEIHARRFDDKKNPRAEIELHSVRLV